MTGSKRLSLLLALVASLGLTACTGTRSTRAPTLLVIGYSEGGEGRLALVEDTFLTEDAVQGRFLFLGATPTPASSVPVAYDLSEREGLRDELVVLSRVGTTGAAYLSLYPVGALSSETSALTPRLELEYAALATPADEPLASCPTRVQTSSSGRYLAVLHDLSLCDGGNLNEAIDFIDLEAEPPAVLRRIENASIVPGALYLEQTEGAERLFYFSEEAGGARLHIVALPAFEDLPSGAIIGESFKNSPSALQDLGRVGENLIALQSNRFVPIAVFGASGATLGTPIATTSGSRRLVPTNSPNPSAVMILGNDTFTVHADAEDANPATTTLTGVVDGSLEPVGGFVYFVSSASNNLPLFDLREYDPSLRDLEFNLGTGFRLGQIQNPTFITWVQSVLPPLEGDGP